MSFFAVYGVENLFAYFPNLYLTWTMMMTIPSFYMMILFFVIFVLVCEIIIYWTSTWYEEKKELKKMVELKIRTQSKPSAY
jgi:hypothetical protein